MKGRADDYTGQIRFHLDGTGRGGLLDGSIFGACCAGPRRSERKMQTNGKGPL
jgi:hypothetical protein